MWLLLVLCCGRLRTVGCLVCGRLVCFLDLEVTIASGSLFDDSVGDGLLVIFGCGCVGFGIGIMGS